MSLFPASVALLALWSPQPPEKVLIPKDLSDWIVSAPPRYRSEQWRAASRSAYEWTVAMLGPKLVVSATDPNQRETVRLPFKIEPDFRSGTSGTLAAMKIEDGWLIGFDQGEWGGSLMPT